MTNERIEEAIKDLTKEQRHEFYWMQRVTKEFWIKNESIDKWSERTDRFHRALFDIANICTDGEHAPLYNELFFLVCNWDRKYPNAEISMYETDEGFGIDDEQYYWMN